MISLFNTIFFNPLYNLLAFFISILPTKDLGIAVILLTVLVKIILFPVSKKATVSQFKLKQLQPEIDKIKIENADKQIQAQKTFALYKKEGVNPFSSCVTLLIQLPVLLALYQVFFKGMTSVNTAILYPFISHQTVVNPLFLNLINISTPNIIFAVLAGLSQYFQLANQPVTQEKPKDENDTQAMLAYSMTSQMKYVLPVVITIVSLKLPAALALYWIVSNVITLIQERIIRKSLVA